MDQGLQERHATQMKTTTHHPKFLPQTASRSYPHSLTHPYNPSNRGTASPSVPPLPGASPPLACAPSRRAGFEAPRGSAATRPSGGHPILPVHAPGPAGPPRWCLARGVRDEGTSPDTGVQTVSQRKDAAFQISLVDERLG